MISAQVSQAGSGHLHLQIKINSRSKWACRNCLKLMCTSAAWREMAKCVPHGNIQDCFLHVTKSPQCIDCIVLVLFYFEVQGPCDCCDKGPHKKTLIIFYYGPHFKNKQTYTWHSCVTSSQLAIGKNPQCPTISINSNKHGGRVTMPECTSIFKNVLLIVLYRIIKSYIAVSSIKSFQTSVWLWGGLC